MAESVKKPERKNAGRVKESKEASRQGGIFGPRASGMAQLMGGGKQTGAASLGESLNAGRKYSPRNFFADSSIVNGVKTGTKTVQTKIKLGQPGDRYEQEADSMADKVMKMDTTQAATSLEKPASPPVSQGISSIQRTEAEPTAVQKMDAGGEPGSANASRANADPLTGFSGSSAEKNSAPHSNEKAIPLTQGGPQHNKDPVQLKENETAQAEPESLALTKCGSCARKNNAQPSTSFQGAIHEKQGVQPASDSAVQTSESSNVQTKSVSGTSDTHAMAPAKSEGPLHNKDPVQAADDSAQLTSEPSVQTKCDAEAPVQRNGETLAAKESDSPASGTPAVVQDSVASSIQSSKGGGSPLPMDTRLMMEGRFAADFSGVRVHTDDSAIKMNRNLRAQAFAHGSDIYFDSGKFNPATHDGQHLLAHELTHTIQQGAAARKKSNEISSAPKSIQGSWLRDKIATIVDRMPGWRMLTFVIGYNPINDAQIDRNAVNLVGAALSLVPFGTLIFDKLQEYGVLEKAFGWISAQFNGLGISWPFIKGLFTQAWEEMGVTLGIDGNLAVMRRIFGPPISKILSFIGGIADAIIKFIKDAVLKPVSAFARKIPGYGLLCALLAKDPITGDAVDRNATNIIRGFLEFVPGGTEKFDDLMKSGAIQKMYAWVMTTLKRLNLNWDTIKSTFSKAWDSLSISDLTAPVAAFNRIAGIFSPLTASVVSFAIEVGEKILEFIFEGIMGAGGAQVLGIIKKARSTFLTVVKNPIGFLGNLIGAVKLGVRQFAGNALKHLKGGLISWLTGSLGGAGLTLPEKWDMKGILGLVLQIMGLTYATIRPKLVARTSEKVVGILEKTFEVVKILLTEGIAGLWQRLIEYVGNLQTMVIEGIRNWVFQKVIMAAVTKLASMFNPVGAVIQAIISIYNTVMFFIEKMNQIMELVSSVVNSIAAIAAGNIAGAANFIESSMAKAIPVLLSFLARLIGLGDVAAPIKKIITAIQAKVSKGVDKVLDWVVEKAKKLVQIGTTNLSPQQKLDLAISGAQKAASKFAGRKVGEAILKPILAGIKLRYGLQSMDLIKSGKQWIVKATINPTKQGPLAGEVDDGKTTAEEIAIAVQVVKAELEKAPEKNVDEKQFIATKKAATEKMAKAVDAKLNKKDATKVTNVKANETKETISAKVEVIGGDQKGKTAEAIGTYTGLKAAIYAGQISVKSFDAAPVIIALAGEAEKLLAEIRKATGKPQNPKPCTGGSCKGDKAPSDNQAKPEGPKTGPAKSKDGDGNLAVGNIILTVQRVEIEQKGPVKSGTSKPKVITIPLKADDAPGVFASSPAKVQGKKGKKAFATAQVDASGKVVNEKKGDPKAQAQAAIDVRLKDLKIITPNPPIVKKMVKAIVEEGNKGLEGAGRDPDKAADPNLTHHSEQAMWQAMAGLAAKVRKDVDKATDGYQIKEAVLHIHSEKEMCMNCAMMSNKFADYIKNDPGVLKSFAGGKLKIQDLGVIVTSTFPFGGKAYNYNEELSLITTEITDRETALTNAKSDSAKDNIAEKLKHLRASKATLIANRPKVIVYDPPNGKWEAAKFEGNGDLKNVLLHGGTYDTETGSVTDTKGQTKGTIPLEGTGPGATQSGPGPPPETPSPVSRKPESQSPETVSRAIAMGQPGDRYEQEADTMADKVMQNNEPAKTAKKSEKGKTAVQAMPLSHSVSAIQRNAESGAQAQMAQDASLQTKCKQCAAEEKTGNCSCAHSGKQRNKDPVQRNNSEMTQSDAQPDKKENRTIKSVPTPVASSIHASKGRGAPLPGATREFMEERFGADFSNVRIHTDTEAVKMNKNLKAQAFAHRNDIYFNSGKFDPGCAEGKRLLAHELTHTIQQGAAVRKTEKAKSAQNLAVMKSDESAVQKADEAQSKSETEKQMPVMKSDESAVQKADEAQSKSEIEKQKPVMKSDESAVQKADEAQSKSETENQMPVMKSDESAVQKADEAQSKSETDIQIPVMKSDESAVQKADEAQSKSETEKQKPVMKSDESAVQKADEAQSKSETEKQMPVMKSDESAVQKADEAQSKSETEKQMPVMKSDESAVQKADEAQSKSETEKQKPVMKSDESAVQKADEAQSKSETENQMPVMKSDESAVQKADEAQSKSETDIQIPMMKSDESAVQKADEAQSKSETEKQMPVMKSDESAVQKADEAHSKTRDESTAVQKDKTVGERSGDGQEAAKEKKPRKIKARDEKKTGEEKIILMPDQKKGKPGPGKKLPGKKKGKKKSALAATHKSTARSKAATSKKKSQKEGKTITKGKGDKARKPATAVQAPVKAKEKQTATHSAALEVPVSTQKPLPPLNELVPELKEADNEKNPVVQSRDPETKTAAKEPATFAERHGIIQDGIDKITKDKNNAVSAIHLGLMMEGSKGELQAAQQRQQIDLAANSALLNTTMKFTKAGSIIQSAFNSAGGKIQSMFMNADTELDGTAVAGIKMVDEVFATHKMNVFAETLKAVGATEELRTKSTDEGRMQMQGQADAARQMGITRAEWAPDSKCGKRQKTAAKETAGQTAKEIEAKIPSNLSAIQEIIQPLPGEIFKGGQQAVEGLDVGKPALYGQVVIQSQAFKSELAKKHKLILNALKENFKLVTSLMKQREIQERVNLATIRSRALQQVEAARKFQRRQQQAVAGFHVKSLEVKAAEAIAVVPRYAKRGKEAVEKFAFAMENFFGSHSNTVIEALKESGYSFAKSMKEVTIFARLAILQSETIRDSFLLLTQLKVQSGLQQMLPKVALQYKEITLAFKGMILAFKKQIEESFQTSILELRQGFKDLLADVLLQIMDAISQGVAKNQEAIALLPGKIEEAVADADWRCRHPVLAFLEDAVSFIGGLLLGILKVLAIFALIIVAFVAGIALLIALGVSAAVAAVIAIVVGVGLLVYSVAQSFIARRNAGQGLGEAFFGSLGDVTGISDIVTGFTKPGLSWFERGFHIGSGAATVATIVLGPKMSGKVTKGLGVLAESARFPKIASVSEFMLRPHVTAPGNWLKSQGGKMADFLGNKVGELFGGRGPPIKIAPEIVPVEQPGLHTRGYKPKPGERSMTREQWKAQEHKVRHEKFVEAQQKALEIERLKLLKLLEQKRNSESVTTGQKNQATVGFDGSKNYKATFFKAHPELEGKVVVHHAIEQQIAKRYPGLFTEGEINSLANLRGIPNELNNVLHLSEIRKSWNKFYRENANPSRQQVLDRATEIDKAHGDKFLPPK